MQFQDILRHFSSLNINSNNFLKIFIYNVNFTNKLFFGIVLKLIQLWITLADRYIQKREINWELTLKKCFNNKNNADDKKLSIQIFKDISRTGSSLYDDQLENQALLKQVLLAYVRFNPSKLFIDN